ncbi:hypothetical protein JCM14036_14120 [Desulfotomaculum defluvii]
MSKGIFVTATGTDVGKTFVAAINGEKNFGKQAIVQDTVKGELIMYILAKNFIDGII